MYIQVLDSSGDMTLKGSHLLTSIHDESSIVDLYVRESIQNSLDAALDNEQPINVEFICGQFEHARLSAELTGLQDVFYGRFDGQKRFLAIKDSNTTGLTGKFLDSDPGEVGNLRKLVFESRESKGENETAGGSWGLGKTIFFRIGIGIVVYYSRIVLNDGRYESRLVASLIEDETLGQRVVCPEYNGKISGIAWWGKQSAGNKVVPITDDGSIASFLDIFGITPYNNEETGTMVIVPYIDLDQILKNELKRQRVSDVGDGDDNQAQEQYRSWLYSFADYMGHTVMKWYYPRLKNPYYRYGKQLSVTITDLTRPNNRSMPLSVATADGAFQLMQALYNRAALSGNLPPGYTDYITEHFENNTNVDVQTVAIREQAEAGKLAYIKLSTTGLRNFGNPNLLFDKKSKDNAFLAFTRSLGMIVWYEDAKISQKPEDEEEYVFAQFVLNSDAQLAGAPNNSLESYIRKTEGPSHKSWDEEKLTIAKRIKEHTRERLKAAFTPQPKSEDSGKNPLGRDLRLILSPDPNKSARNGNRRTSTKIQTSCFSAKLSEVKYSPFKVKYDLTLKKNCDFVDFKLMVARDGKSLTIKELSPILHNYPFKIKSASFKIKKGSKIDVNADNRSAAVAADTDTSVKLKLENNDDNIKIVPMFNQKSATADQIEEIIASLTIELEIEDVTLSPEIQINGVKK